MEFDDVDTLPVYKKDGSRNEYDQENIIANLKTNNMLSKTNSIGQKS